MSRFSKTAAEKAGWKFVHYEPESVADLGDGITRTVPATLRAERYVDGKLVNEEAPTIGLLLERISAFEAHAEARGLNVAPEPSTSVSLPPRSEDGWDV